MVLAQFVAVAPAGCSRQIYRHPMKRYQSISSLQIYFQIWPNHKQIILNQTKIKMGLVLFLFVLLHQQFHRYHLPYQNSRQSRLIQINQTQLRIQKCQKENPKRVQHQNFSETKNVKSVNRGQLDFITMSYHVKHVK